MELPVSAQAWEFFLSAMLGAALAEGTAIFGLVVAILIILFLG